MELLKLQDIQLKKDKYIFKESSIIHLFIAIFMVLLIPGCIFLFKIAKFPVFITIMSNGFLGLFALLQFNAFMKTRSPSNWLLAFNNERVLIKFRSYLNIHFPKEDKQIISIPFNEIYAVRITNKEIKYPNLEPGPRGYQTQEKFTYLDIITISKNLEELQQQLKYERNIKIKGKSSYKHCPVSIVDNKIIRIEWKSKRAAVIPGINSAIKALDQFVSREIDVYEREDFVSPKALQRKDLEDKILELAEQGNTSAATKIAMKAYNWNFTQAHEFVEELLE